jgi:Family of unknown function (DUF6496)
MPTRKTVQRARRDKRRGKSPSTQAGEFVREEIEDIRAGKHGARSARQAIAIGLSKARRAGVKLPPPRAGAAPESVRRRARRDLEAGRAGPHAPDPERSAATKRALKREGRTAASHAALARQARRAAAKRGAASRRRSARRAARTRARERR